MANGRWHPLAGLLDTTRTLRRVWGLSLAAGAYSCLAILKERSQYHNICDIPADIHASLSLVLGLLLVFRTNSAYSRWWEARTLWGKLVNDSRNLVVKLRTLADLTGDELRDAGGLIIAFAQALKDHLRDGVELADVPALQDCDASPAHVPSHIAHLLYERIDGWRKQGRIDDFTLLVIDKQAEGLLDVCGGCERIRKTPFSKSYVIFVRRCILLYLLTVPWGLAHALGIWTAPATIIVAYFMIGIELIAEDVLEPFGLEEDDLDLDDLCRTIEVSVRQIAEEE